jgi:hypothetical protein
MLRWSDPVLPVEREVAPVLVASVRVLGFISLSPTYRIAKQVPFRAEQSSSHLAG